MFFSKNGKLNVVGICDDNSNKYEIKIAKSKTHGLLKQFNFDYAFLCSYLRVLGDRLVLLNPVISHSNIYRKFSLMLLNKREMS